MKKKKLFLLPLISAMFLMVGCSGGNQSEPVDEGGNEQENEGEATVEYWNVSFAQGNYTNLKLFSDDALSKEITDNKVVKGNALFFSFSLSNPDTEELETVKYGAVTDATLTEATFVSDTNGYVYKVPTVSAHITVTITTKAKEVTPPGPTEDGYAVSFDLKDHVTDLKVYKSEDRSATNVDSAEIHYSRDSATGEATKADGQINFEFKIDSGYQLKSISATDGTYKNIKFLGIVDGVVLAKVTKITADTKITVEAEENTVEHVGNTVTVVKGEGVASVTIYNNCGFTAGTEVSGLVTQSIEQETGHGTKSKGRIYFIATMADGYEFDSITFDPADCGAEADTDDPEGSHVIKKISKDITVTVNAKSTSGGEQGGGEGGEQGGGEEVADGYDVTFNKTIIDGNSWNGKHHISALTVYTDKNMTTEDEGTTVSQGWSTVTTYDTRNGDTGEKTTTDGQINFSVTPEEGYQVKSVSCTAGTYKNIKYVGAGEGLTTNWRVTKISANTTITVELETVKDGWPVTINGGIVKVFTDETFATEISDPTLISMDATGSATKTNGNLYFQVSAPNGFALTADEPTLNIDGAGKLKAVTVEGKENCYKLTSIVCACEVTFKTNRDATTTPFLYYKSTTKANTYTSGSNIAQNGDTYFVVGADMSSCVIMWFWTYQGDELKEEINIQIGLEFDGTNMNVVGDPIAQYNGEATDREEWQHCSTRSFPVVEIAATDIPSDFVHYTTLFTSK